MNLFLSQVDMYLCENHDCPKKSVPASIIL